MTYRIKGLDPAPFRPLFALDDAALTARRARRATANGPGFPCRVSLEDAEEGEALLLLNHVSHDVATPFRASHAIYVREAADRPALFEDRWPRLLDRRAVSLRGFDAEGMLRDGRLVAPGEGDRAVHALFADAEIAEIHAHTATYGCFLARIERH